MLSYSGKTKNSILTLVPASLGIGIIASLATGSYIWLLAPLAVAGAGVYSIIPRNRSNRASIAIFRISVKKGQEQRLASIVSSRSQSEAVAYVIVDLLEAGGSSIIVAIATGDPDRLKLESEVFKSLVRSIIPGAQIESVESERLAEAVSAILADDNIVHVREPVIPIVAEADTEKEGIELGSRLDGLGKAIITLDDVKGHIGVFGSTGSGKSTTLSVIAEGASRLGLYTVILDWTGEYSRILSSRGINHVVVDPLSSKFSLNPFKLGLDTSIIVNILSSALSLTEPQEYMLMKTMKEGRVSSLEELEAIIDAIPEEAKWDREVKRGLLRKLGPLTLASGSNLFSGSPEEPKGDLVIVDASRIGNVQARRLYVMLYLAMSFYNPGRERLIIIDEAHNIVGEGSILIQMLAESRKYGAYIALATQSPAAIDNGVILNTNTKIIHALRSPRDREIIAESIGLPREDSEMLARLAPGEAIVFAPSIGFPVAVNIYSRKPT